ncbi:ADP-ribosylation [Xylariaceae sp. FL0016]|nr:ADP-ribosylation [Xylariaceae sp. FL0016]
MEDHFQLSEDDLVELSLFRDFETDALIEAGLLSKDEQQSRPLDEVYTFKYHELDLNITAGPRYPADSVIWTVDNHILSRKAIIELRTRLRHIAESADETNNVSKWTERETLYDLGVFEPVMAVLEIAKETTKHIRIWREKHEASTVPQLDPNGGLPFEVKEASSTMTTSDLALKYLRRTPEEICVNIPPSYRVLHVEEVLRSDLARAFEAKQDELREFFSRMSYSNLAGHVPPQYRSSRKEDLIEYLVRPHLTFHGTQRQFVPSIVRYGFLKPGTINPGLSSAHQVRCGSTYGRGIYSSPLADFALCYVDPSCHRTSPSEYFGIKLIVCATLMGRAAALFRDDNWRLQTECYENADSHVANNQREYIVFDKAQIIPVYVIHIDWGADNASRFADLPSNPTSYVSNRKKTHPKLLKDVKWPLDIQRERLAIKARASKWFPCGYGPATGGRFVVEEVGEIDDDEETYGDYQAFRMDETAEASNLDYWSWVKAGEAEDAAGQAVVLDEYSTEKRSHKNPNHKRHPEDWDAIPLAKWSDGEDEDETEERDTDDGLGLSRLLSITPLNPDE